MNRGRKIKLTAWVAVVLALVGVLTLSTIGCSSNTNAADLAITYNFSCDWSGVNGAEFNLPGASTLWILSGGGGSVGGYTEASLHVVYSNGHTADIIGVVEGNGGSVHFEVPADDSATVTSATAHYNDEKNLDNPNCVVTISHVIVESTTTTAGETTTTAGETTTTAGETTTTEGQTTTTVGEESSTTTEGQTTTTTEAQTTTTVGEESSTTTEGQTTTTTEAQTTTTVGEESSTTTEGQTTTTVGEESSTTTTVGELTTVTGVQTGGGGTAGPGAGTWVLGLFAIALAGGFGWTAVRSMRK